MQIVKIKNEYINDLRRTFSHIMINKGEYNTHIRKYIGVIFKVKKINYYAPFSSPKNYDYKPDGNPKESSKFVIRMIAKDSGKNKLYGKILINCMIPVPDEFIIKFDINNERDKRYRDLLLLEFIWINKNKSNIYKSAELAYKSKDKILLPYKLIEKYVKKRYQFN